MRLKKIAYLFVAAVVVGALAVVLVAVAVAENIGLHPGPHTNAELTIIAVLEFVVAAGTAVVFAIILAVGGGRVAIRRAAVTLIVLLVSGLAAVEIFGQASSGSTDFTRSQALASDLPLLLLIGLPSLLTVTIEWWIVLQAVSKPLSENRNE